MLKQMSRSKLAATVGALAAAVLLTTLARPAQAALFIVDTKAVDLGDLIPGDGKCEFSTIVPVGQRCSLRAAVQEANALAGADVILIPNGWHIVLTRQGKSEDNAALGDLDILEDLAIGSLAPPESWPVVDANGIDRVFDVFGPAELTLAQVEVRGGSSLQGGALHVRSTAGSDLSSCRLVENFASSGAAIANLGTTTVRHCAIERNRGNGAAGDEAIVNLGGGVLGIHQSTVVDNDLISAAISNVGFLTVTNTTIAYNDGAGISSANDLVLRNVTIVGNDDEGLAVNQPGAFLSPSIKNSVIAGNGNAPAEADCKIIIAGGIADIAYPNLDSDGSCGFLPAFGGLPNTDPKLGPLQLNGGTTRTMVPGVGSPVIDKGNNATCEAVDQRGASRPLDGNETAGVDCDIGAVEVLPCVGTPFLVVTGGFISIPVTYTGCFTITAGPALDITATGNVTFRTRDAVRFTNGFSVQSGGKLQVVLDPAAGSGITLP